LKIEKPTSNADRCGCVLTLGPLDLHIAGFDAFLLLILAIFRVGNHAVAIVIGDLRGLESGAAREAGGAENCEEQVFLHHGFVEWKILPGTPENATVVVVIIMGSAAIAVVPRPVIIVVVASAAGIQPRMIHRWHIPRPAVQLLHPAANRRISGHGRRLDTCG
jgi:hypothetical protein